MSEVRDDSETVIRFIVFSYRFQSASKIMLSAAVKLLYLYGVMHWEYKWIDERFPRISSYGKRKQVLVLHTAKR